jgi:hypothetical protein
MRDAPLTVLRGGINRLRTKGGARADNLYDLLNGYLTEDGTVHVRPGTLRVATLPAATKGLTYFNGSRHVFAAEAVAVPTGYTLHVLTSPEQDPGEAVIPIKKIHFAEPFLGFLYVVAEFDDDSVWHFWLEEGTTWETVKIYYNGDLATPSAPNGLAYRATRSTPTNPVWTANAPRTVGDVVEPTEYNGFYYVVTDTQGATPTSAATEPLWPTEEGQTIVESTDITPEPPPADAVDPNAIAQDIIDRYGNGNGGF